MRIKNTVTILGLFISFVLAIISFILNIPEMCTYFTTISDSKLFYIVLLRVIVLVLILSVVIINVYYNKKERFPNKRICICYIAASLIVILLAAISGNNMKYYNHYDPEIKLDSSYFEYFPYYNDFENKNTNYIDANLFKYSEINILGNNHISITNSGGQNDLELSYRVDYFKTISPIMKFEYMYQIDIPNGKITEIDNIECIINENDESYTLFITNNNECYSFMLFGDGYIEYLKPHSDDFANTAIKVYKSITSNNS